MDTHIMDLGYPFNDVIPARIISSTSNKLVAMTVLKRKKKKQHYNFL